MMMNKINNFSAIITPNIIHKLAEKGEIPSDYMREIPQVTYVVEEVNRLHDVGLIETPFEAVNYVKTLLATETFSSDYENMVVYLVGLSKTEKEKLVGLSEKELLEMTEDDVKKLISSSS